MSSLKKIYDAIPYPLYAFYRTHPSHLATIGQLFGLDTPDITQCRVLELGCASGSNLFLMAMHFPDSQFVGVDLSPRQIEDGKRMVADLGIGNNLHLEAMNVLDMPAQLGQFDFIIAHGFLSWIPASVRDATFGIFQRHLAPQGIVYVSYNTYPGYYFAQGVNDFMKYHTAHLPDPAQWLPQARDIVRWAYTTLQEAGNLTGDKSFDAYINQLQIQLEIDERRAASSLLHDELAEFNQPYYFHQIMEWAQAHGLKYLADAYFPAVRPEELSPDAEEQLDHLAGGDAVRREQYLDFLLNRRFRRTLLVHDAAQIDDIPAPERLRSMFFRSRAQIAPDNDPSQLPTHYTSPDGMDVELDFGTDHAITGAALTVLIEVAPHALTLDELLARARAKLGLAVIEPDDVATLLEDFLLLFGMHEDLVLLQQWRPDLPTTLATQPIAHPLSRLLAQRGQQIVNQWHERYIQSDALVKRLLPYVDGTRDKAALLTLLHAWVAAGDITLDNTEHVQALDHALQWMLDNAVLMRA